MGEINIDKESINKLYIAYGSNLNLRQMESRCPTAEIIGRSEITDYELVFKGSKTNAVATIEPCEGSVVPVLVWDIKDEDEKALDRYEGYPYFYDKKKMEITMDGNRIPAMVYIMTEGHEYGNPSESYLRTIEEGYIDSGFDVNVLDNVVVNNIELVKLQEKKLGETSEDVVQKGDEDSEKFKMKWW